VTGSPHAARAASVDPAAPELARIAARAAHMMGADGAAWTTDQALAWEGLLELGRRLRRRADDMLAHDFGLSISMLGIMGRLAGADGGTLRQTALADALGLSVSRASRVIDLLESRELVVRTACPLDARATNVALTPAGRARTAGAQRAVFALVSETFADRITPEEFQTLARVFARLLLEDRSPDDTCG
jgi:DNA-binding MarR family transcriptional regulator